VPLGEFEQAVRDLGDLLLSAAVFPARADKLQIVHDQDADALRVTLDVPADLAVK
jgi:hypothetical protein